MSDASYRGSSVEHDSDPLTITEQCKLVANERRRHVLRYLIDQTDEIIHKEELIAHLRRVERTAETTNIRLALEHVHLPKLSQEGVIEYTTGECYIDYRPHEELEDLLAFFEEFEGVRDGSVANPE